jgi:hypothetical protein
VVIEWAQNAFTSGEVSTHMLMRQDLNVQQGRYKQAALLLHNWQVLPQGGLRRRPGFRRVAQAKFADTLVRLLPFEPSTTDAYILEIGDLYIRFYKNNARLEVSSTPVEIAMPYRSEDLRDLRTAQSNDVMLMAHPLYAPRRLSRLSDTSWVLSLLPFRPPPLFEAGHVGGTSLTLSGTTGTITATAGAAFFMQADLNRQLTAGVGRGIIVAFTSATQVSLLVLDPFNTTSYTSGQWTITGSPVAELGVSATGPVGSFVTVTAGGLTATAAEMVTNGLFASGLTGWTNLSAPLVLQVTHNGANNTKTLFATGGADMVTAGVLPTHRVNNVTDGSWGTVNTVSSFSLFLTGAPNELLGGAENDFDTGDIVQILKTGSAVASGGQALLAGGTAGYGWIEQGIVTTAGTTYEWRFTVTGGSLGSCLALPRDKVTSCRKQATGQAVMWCM